MATKSKPGASESKSRIFVVEDHPVFAEGIVRLINAEADLTVCGTAGDAETAIKQIKTLKPNLALVDLGLPGKSGMDLIKEVRGLKLPVKLLVVSMYDEALYAQRVLRAGGDGYIMKQEDPQEIVDAIRDVLDGRIYVSEEVMAAEKSAKPAATTSPSSVSRLTDLELEILESLGEGKSDAEIAAQFQLPPKAVTTHCSQIRQKLDLKSSNALIRYAVCWVEGTVK